MGNPAELPDPSPGAPDLRLPVLTRYSREVLEILAQHQEGRADRFFEGALRALGDPLNPVGAEAAAYCLRELIEELERAALPPPSQSDLGELLDGFSPAWKKAKRRPEDNGLLDNCDPAVFAADQFIETAEATRVSRRDRAQTTFSELNPVRRPNPPDIQQARVKRLLAFRDEFNHVLHGEEPTNPAEFKGTVEAFESFLLAWLAPRTFDDFSEIDKLLEEGPPE
jgi:hypothetical protein